MRLNILVPVAALLTVMSAQSEIIHRWSFNESAGAAPSGTTVIDSVSSAVATIRGTGAVFNASSIVLPGGSNGQNADTVISAYVDLPNGIISSKTDLTIEIWATPLSSQNWSRLFDFGRTVQAGDGVDGEWTGATAPDTTQMSDGLFLSLQQGGDINQQRLEGTLDTVTYTLNSTEATTLGIQYHYVVTYESGAGTFPSGGLATWYRDGVLIGSLDLPYALSEVEDVNNWLGRSQWSGDMNAHAAYNELRIYDSAMTDSEVQASYYAGPEQGLRYRWSFNEGAGAVTNGSVFSDTISDAPATVRGQGAVLTTNAIVLPGTTTGDQTPANVSAYVDLPNGIISSLEDLTIEAWATPIASRNWQRLFDFGSASAGDGLGETGEWTGDAAFAPGATTASDEFALTLTVGADLNTQRLYARLDYDQGGGLNIYSETENATIAGEQHHYVVTYENGAGSFGAAGGRQIWYRDGVAIATNDLPYHLADIDDVNNWLGRSQFAGDDLSNASFDEFRIYSFAFTTNEVVSSRNAGPDALYSVAPPVTVPDAVTMHNGGKALIPVLDNDTGFIYAQTVAIDTPPTEGAVTVQPSGSVLYSNANPSASSDSFTYTVNGLGGVSDPATVSVTFSDNLRIANPSLAMPETPPSTFYELSDALPGVNFDQPICMASPPGETKRLFVCERMAKIQVVPDVTAVSPSKQLFLDLQLAVTNLTPDAVMENWALGENGILGLAFHPNYASNGYFYVAYTVQTNNGSPFFQRISRFSVSGGDPNQADSASEIVLLQQLDQGFNHNGGDLHFGPDGYLYYAAGDEENPNDFRQNSQRLTKDFFAGIFRFDVDKGPESIEPNPHASIPTNSAGLAYFSVPTNNPFVHTSLGGDWDGTYNGISLTNNLDAIRMEYWATGLRHPWRISFDPMTGDLWAGDVGQDTYEEVDLVVKGGNYGWVWREGQHDTGLQGPVPPGFSSIDPVYEYVHTGVSGGDAQFKGNSICGGYVYRGSRFPELYGRYVFCDSVSGHVWELNPTNGVVSRITGVAGTYGYLVSMGVDPSNHDILFADFINGRILRLTTGESAGSFPQTLSETGLFADLTDLSPNPGLLPYDINLSFWSDYAIKSRWFAIPDATNTMTWARDANWTIPDGMLWVKHFDLELERGNPATRKRIETRVLTKTASDYYGVSYQWNEAGTEAYLVSDSGEDFDLEIVDGGVTNIQRWSIPSRSSCLTCHTPQAGRTLGFTTRQMNKVSDMGGFIGNELELLHQGGYFANEPDAPNTLPRHVRPDEISYPLEERARSYIAVNCAYCHRSDGTVSGANWDGRPELALFEMGLINGEAVNDNGNPTNRYVVPGDTLHSIVYNRVAETNGFGRMPPLATSELDHEGIDLLHGWITSELQLHQDYTAWRFDQFGSTNSPQGEAGFDADEDFMTNYEEFVAGTLPLDPSSYLVSQVSIDGSSVSVEFSVPGFRSAYIETADEPGGPWERWDVPGNSGLMRPAGVVTITGAADDAKRFFRLVMEER